MTYLGQDSQVLLYLSYFVNKDKSPRQQQASDIMKILSDI